MSQERHNRPPRPRLFVPVHTLTTPPPHPVPPRPTHFSFTLAPGWASEGRWGGGEREKERESVFSSSFSSIRETLQRQMSRLVQVVQCPEIFFYYFILFLFFLAPNFCFFFFFFPRMAANGSRSRLSGVI